MPETCKMWTRSNRGLGRRRLRTAADASHSGVTVRASRFVTSLANRARSEVLGWQNGTAERWVGSCRRELRDHVIVLDERYFLRLLCDYISYHHRDRVRFARKGHSGPNGPSSRSRQRAQW